jgi:hypothetical protein
LNIKIRTFLKNNTKEILAALILALTLFFFAPISVYINNAKSLNFALNDIWYLYFIASVAVFLVFFIVLQIVKPIFPYISTIFILFSVGFIVQGYFLNYDIGPLDGHDIQWDSFRNKYWFDLFLWVTLIGVFFFTRRFLYKNIKEMVIFLLIFQVSVNLISAISNPHRGQGLYFDTSKEFEYSQSKNVVLIVLDTFRSEAFDQVLQKYPDYKEVLKDFVFYQDALGGYPTTRTSIPLILTGEYYDNSIPISEFIEEFQKQSIPFILQENGFHTENYSSVTNLYSSAYNNQVFIIPFAKRASITIKQYYITGIRYMPLALKQFFVNKYYQGDDYIHKDMIDFIDRVDITKSTSLQPTFKFYHFFGAHPPFQLDNNLDFVNKGYIEQSAASLKVVQNLILQMKKADVYNNSLIIILGDHGSTEPWEYDGTTLAYSSQPLILAKKVNQHFEEIKLSDARVSLMDIPKTITEEINIENSYPGFSIFEPIPTDRSRRWFYYAWEHSYWSVDYLPTLYEFEIRGPANQHSSYKLVKKYTENAITTFDTLNYQYSDNIVSTILSNEELRIFHALNFSYEQTEDSFWSWAVGPKSCVNLPVKQTGNSLTLSIIAQPFLVSGQLEDQAMNVLIDQVPLATFHKNDKMEAVISPDLAKQITQDGFAIICFEFPDATRSPSNYGTGIDPRLLAYSFSSIKIVETTPIDLPKQFVLNLETKADDLSILKSGWSHPEQDFIWTDGNSALLSMLINNSQKDIILKISAFPYLGNNHIEVQNVTILSSGQKTGNWTISKEGQYSTKIPADTVKDGILDIELKLPDAASPKELSLGEDPRLLGIAVYQIQVTIEE